MATTASPTWTALESPRGRGSSAGALAGSTLSSATSLVSSTPTTVAATVVVSVPLLLCVLNTTFTESAVAPLLETTCALVRMAPSAATTKPEPSACALDEFAPYGVARDVLEGREHLDDAGGVLVVD